MKMLRAYLATFGLRCLDVPLLKNSRSKLEEKEEGNERMKVALKIPTCSYISVDFPLNEGTG